MVIAMRNMKATIHRTGKAGFRAEIMRWNPGREFGGILLRGFGWRFMWYGTRP